MNFNIQFSEKELDLLIASYIVKNGAYRDEQLIKQLIKKNMNTTFSPDDLSSVINPVEMKKIVGSMVIQQLLFNNIAEQLNMTGQELANDIEISAAVLREKLHMTDEDIHEQTKEFVSNLKETMPNIVQNGPMNIANNSGDINITIE